MRVGKALLAIVALFLILAVGVYFLRLSLAGIAVRGALASAGLENSQARVTALSLSRIEIRNIAAGGNENSADKRAITLDEVVAQYEWRTLLSDRRIKSISAGPGMVRLEISEDGKVGLPGVTLGGSGSGGALPFDRLILSNIDLVIETPGGEATGTLNADYDLSQGGKVELRAEALNAGRASLSMENAAADFTINLTANGEVVFAGAFNGDIATPTGPLRDIDLSVEGKGQSWRDFAQDRSSPIKGVAQISLRSAKINISEFESLARIKDEQSAILFGAPVSSLSATAAIELAIDGDKLTAALEETPLLVKADNGAALTITTLNDQPLLDKRGDKITSEISYTLTGATVSAVGTINAQTTDDGWFIVAPIQIGEYRSRALKFDEASAIFHVTTAGPLINADISTTSAIDELSIGRFSLKEAPFSGQFFVTVDKAQKTATVTLPESRCLQVERAETAIAQQDTEATFKNATLCADSNPLALIDWSEDLQCTLSGVVSADALDYRLGRTTIFGRPPRIEFSGTYLPRQNLTTVSGDISGGSIILRDMLRLDAVEGQYEFNLDKTRMVTTGQIDKVRISQNEKSPRIAPVYGSGVAQLDAQTVTFDYVLRTLRGERLGAGDGEHNVTTASGASTFTFDRIEFTEDTIQPNKLAPVLKGFIGETTGFADGVVDFSWAPDDLQSRAKISLEDITFVGPTRIVNKTSGVNGTIKFSSLWPVATEDVQELSVESVDMFTLPLEDGTIRFHLPGDETLSIERAEFPWFGGTLGVYDANMSVTGETASVPLRANAIDLAKILAYVDVDGLSGEGILSGVLPMIVEDGKAKIVDGVLTSDGPGAVQYVGKAVDAAAAEDRQAEIAFDILRDLQYKELGVTVNGPLDGRLEFQMNFAGSGNVALNQQFVRVPVDYKITLDAALLELLNQVNLSRDIKLQIEQAATSED